MMNHRMLQGFSRDDALRGRRLNRATMRRVLGYVRPYRAILVGFLVLVGLCVYFSLSNSSFYDSDNIKNIAETAAPR